ncbi:hypothetical protein PybrP1_001447 [[Pythium] brassicae (nom. inval.)]|nr:hypothetical protein PybrP1_001447 [[Pythium] brassicae (nom. inval.)]
MEQQPPPPPPPHAVNPMGMAPQTMSMPMGMQQAMSMPMSAAGGAANPLAMGMAPASAYGVPPPSQMMMLNGMSAPQMAALNAQQQQQQMNLKMGQMGAMNPGMQMAGGAVAAGGPQGMGGADWRIQLTREHRANLIAKIYNEMVRVASDPPPGIKLWMNVSWYELTLYKESRTQEDYITKIFNRLKSLRAQPTDMTAAMAAQTMPNNGMLSRLDFSYYSNPAMGGVRAMPPQGMGPGVVPGPQPGYPGHPQQFAGHPGAPQPQIKQQQQQQQQQLMPTGAPNGGGMPSAQVGGGNPGGATPDAAVRAGLGPGAAVKSEAALGNVGDSAAEYWRQHVALKAKYHDDVEKVHSAFKKYVDHMKDHNETDQKKKLRYLLSYVQLCASVLSEDQSTHQPRKLEELDKVYKYIVKIVNPYLKKLRTETDKRSFPPGAGGGGGVGGAGAPPSAGPTPSGGASNQPTQAPGGSSQAQPQSAQQQQQQQRAHLDDSLYMEGSLLQMPSNLGGAGSSSGYSMGFPNDLSPTGFGDLGMLDMDGSGLMSYDGQDAGMGGRHGGGGGGGGDANGDDNGEDLMTFVEAL